MKIVILALAGALIPGSGALAQSHDAFLEHGFQPNPYATTVNAGGGDDLAALSEGLDVNGLCTGWIPQDASFVFFYGSSTVATDRITAAIDEEDPIWRDRLVPIEITVTGDVDLVLALEAPDGSIWCDSAGSGDNQARITLAAGTGGYHVYVGTRRPNMNRRVRLTVREMQP